MQSSSSNMPTQASRGRTCCHACSVQCFICSAAVLNYNVHSKLLVDVTSVAFDCQRTVSGQHSSSSLYIDSVRLLLTMVLYRVHLVLRTAVRLRTVVARFPMSRIVDRDPGTHTIIIVSTIQVFPPNWPSLTPARWSKYHKINYYNMLATYNKNIVTHCECFTWCTVDFQGTIQSWSDFSGKWRYTHSAMIPVSHYVEP